MGHLPVALQVYSIRDDAEKDFQNAMDQVKAMGYDGVELAGLYGYSPEKIREALDKAGLRAISAHVPFVEMTTDLEGTIRKYLTIGCEYIAVPYLTEDLRPQGGKFDQVVDDIIRIGGECRKKGLRLLYHNHDFEFVKMPDGRYALDYLYDKAPADVLETELDTCWVKVSGEQPESYVKKYTGRSPIVHLKDFTGSKSEHMYELIGLEGDEKAKAENTFAFRAVGYGVQDFPAILKASLEAGAEWVVVEQDAHYENTAMEDARLSREYLKGLGW